MICEVQKDSSDNGFISGIDNSASFETWHVGKEVKVVKSRDQYYIVPIRHARLWNDLGESEQIEAAKLISPCRENFEDIEATQVVFCEAGPHFHIRISSKPPRHNIITRPPHERSLISGGDDYLENHLVAYIDRAQSVDMAISFLMMSGVEFIRPHLQNLLERKGRLRLLTTDYQDVTDPDALRLLLDMDGNAELHAFLADKLSFHPKAWIFQFNDGNGALLVGSSNLSKSALTSGVEWNLRHELPLDAHLLNIANQEFNALLNRKEVVELDREWIDEYEARRNANPRYNPVEESKPLPQPHEIQAEALEKLKSTRESGYRAGMVVLATGLGKTFLAAFDSLGFDKVMFVAHRDEILAQAMMSFRSVRPRKHMGKFAGREKAVNVDIVFSSVQTLSKSENLKRFTPDEFDYIIVDEFHHAAAETYRRIIDYFNPKFLLGLTATPFRTDGRALLGLCEENLVYECDLWNGIKRGLLSPFSYFGVPDIVDYAQIPWRSGRFDESELTSAVATEARAENALDQLAKRGGRKCLGFCVSRRHADYMAKYAAKKGYRAVSVHSGATSSPRASALKELEKGKLDIVFAVDMFNEGVDVPSIDTVLMLRPTESNVIWLQQIGRGLRKSLEKTHLSIIDYIGNHRVFLSKAQQLLRSGQGDTALAEALRKYELDEISLPIGCEITYELESLEILRSKLRTRRDKSKNTDIDEFYLDFRERNGRRPTACDVDNAGINPADTEEGGWLEYVAGKGDLVEAQLSVASQFRDLLRYIQNTGMTKSYKMVIIRSLIENNRFPGNIAVEDMVRSITRMAMRNPVFLRDFNVNLNDREKLLKSLKRYPFRILSESDFFKCQGSLFRTTFDVHDELKPVLRQLAAELVDWRIQRYLQNKALNFK